MTTTAKKQRRTNSMSTHSGDTMMELEDESTEDENIQWHGSNIIKEMDYDRNNKVVGNRSSSSLPKQLCPAQTTPTKESIVVTGLPLPPSAADGRRASLMNSSISSSLDVSTISSSQNKLNELRAHKKSVESHLKRMVSPHYPKSMIGNLRKELSTNQQIIQEQKMLLHQSAFKQKSHERIIAEQKIQLRLLANKMKQGSDKNQTRFRTMWTTSRNSLGTANIAAAASLGALASSSPTEQRLDRWKDRFQKDIEEKFDALLEQYSRQLDYVDKEYDVRTYKYHPNRLLHLPNMIDGGGSGLFFLVKVLFIILLWIFHY